MRADLKRLQRSFDSMRTEAVTAAIAAAESSPSVTAVTPAAASIRDNTRGNPAAAPTAAPEPPRAVCARQLRLGSGASIRKLGSRSGKATQARPDARACSSC